MSRPDSRLTVRRALTWVLIVLLFVLLIWGLKNPSKHMELIEQPEPTLPTATSTAPVIIDGPTLSTTAPARAGMPKQCVKQASEGFTLQSVEILGVGRYPVEGKPLVVVLDDDGNVAARRLPIPADDNPGVFAWENETTPTVPAQRTVRLTAHTWELTGDALGDIIGASVEPGSVIVLHGDKPLQKACYEVTNLSQVDVMSENSGKKRAAERELERYDGSQADALGIMVCKERVGAGEYRLRLNVFAKRLAPSE